MLGLSLHGWENAMVVLLIVAGFTAFAAGVATWVVVRLQRIELANSEREFTKYKLDTSKEISEANARAAEAQLALEKFKAPRELDSNAGTPLVEGLKEFAGTRVDVIVNLAGSDTYFFGNRVYLALHNAGWKAKTWNAIGSFPIAGVAVSVSIRREEDPQSRMELSKKLRTAGDKIIALLTDAGVEARTGMPFAVEDADGGPIVGHLVSGSVWDPNDIAPIRIIVGPKPQ